MEAGRCLHYRIRRDGPARPSSNGQRETSNSGIHHFARPHAGSVEPRLYYRPPEPCGSPIWSASSQNNRLAKPRAPASRREVRSELFVYGLDFKRLRCVLLLV
jgi:hypothetical protein